MFRLAAAVVMAVVFFLPVSSCSNQLSVDQGNVSTEAPGGTENSHTRYRYPYDSIAIDEPVGLLIVVAYFWPIVAVGYRKKRPHRAGAKFTALELLLCLLSYWAVLGQTFLETPEIGAYIAYCATTLYGVAVVANLLDIFRVWRRKKSATSRR